MEPIIYKSARRYTANRDGYLEVKQKKKIVIVDNDAREVVLIPNHVTAIVATGFTRDEMINLYSEASAVVDLHLNGFERLACEGVLFDAYPIVTMASNGRGKRDFNLPDFAKVDMTRPDAGTILVRTITYVVDHWGELREGISALQRKSFTTSGQCSSFLSTNFQLSRTAISHYCEGSLTTGCLAWGDDAARSFSASQHRADITLHRGGE